MASLNASKRDRFNRLLQRRWKREQSRKRFIEPAPEPSVATVTTELTAPIDELPEDDPRKISFESIKKAINKLPGPRLGFPAPKQIAEIKNLEGGETMYWLNTKGITVLESDRMETISRKLDWSAIPIEPTADPPIETKVYLDGQEVATMKRESMIAEEQRTALNEVGKAVNDALLYGQASIDVEFWNRTPDPNVFLSPYCKANCGERTDNQSGYCTTCLDRMALVGRAPEPVAKTPLVELRPKRQIQLED